MLTLRGVGVEWLNWCPTTAPGACEPGTDTPLDSHNLTKMPTWTSTGAGGINVVRVYLGEQFWLPDQCNYLSSYQSTVTAVVNQITSEGMVALLDLHWSTEAPYGLTGTPCPIARQQAMADANALRFWQSVATAFMSNPLVAFDLYNEPNLCDTVADGVALSQPATWCTSPAPPDWKVWSNGGQVSDGQKLFTAVGMQAMYDVIRQVGAQNLIFVDGDLASTAPPPNNVLVSGTNIVYAVHAYNCPSTPCPPGSTSPPSYLNEWTTFLTLHPTMITEFGWPDASDGTFNQNVINWAESHNVGWIAHDWDAASPSTSTDFGILTDLSTDNPEPSGAPVQAGVGKNA